MTTKPMRAKKWLKKQMSFFQYKELCLKNNALYMDYFILLSYIENIYDLSIKNGYYPIILKKNCPEFVKNKIIINKKIGVCIPEVGFNWPYLIIFDKEEEFVFHKLSYSDIELEIKDLKKEIYIYTCSPIGEIET